MLLSGPGCSGGVSSTDSPVNSESKYRVSMSDVTWGLNGGVICTCHQQNTFTFHATLQVGDLWSDALIGTSTFSLITETGSNPIDGDCSINDECGDDRLKQPKQRFYVTNYFYTDFKGMWKLMGDNSWYPVDILDIRLLDSVETWLFSAIFSVFNSLTTVHWYQANI